jgi:hypothetical protein
MATRQLINRRAAITTIGKTAAGIFVASLVPQTVQASNLCPYCGVAPFGPMHSYLHSILPPDDAIWADQIIARESTWNPSAKNPSSTAAGLAQFLDSTFQWGCERFGMYGDVYDGYFSIALMCAFINAGERYHWACTVESGCAE